MKKLILSSLCMLIGLTSMSAQNALQNEILEVAHRTNNYFMTKYSDPTLDTFVKKVRTSNLWTRAVYYEGLMALYEIDPQQRYLDYTDKWADYHKWTARGSVNGTVADSCRFNAFHHAFRKVFCSSELKEVAVYLRVMLAGI